MGGVAEPVVREVLVSSSVNKAEGCVPSNVPRVRSADQTFVAAQGGVPPNVPRVWSADQPEEVASVDKVAKDAQVVQAGRVVLAHAEEGASSRYRRIVPHAGTRRGAPQGATLATVRTAAAKRERRRMTNFGNVEAAVWLHEREKRKLVVEQVQQQTTAQFDWAAAERPWKYRSRFERMLFDGPTARRDAEEAERQRWLQILADLLRHSPTPMGE